MGADVSLSLEAFDLAVHGRDEVETFVVCGSDDLRLLRKLTAIGMRWVLVGEHYQHELIDAQEERRRKETRTSQVLIQAAADPLATSERIERGWKKFHPLVEGLFVPH
ncbi:MAG: hypothetical protein N2652_05540 [Kiritimatiellae bacterium]|nr:hypothetical protein [Kiritimatiellia bacterium]